MPQSGRAGRPSPGGSARNPGGKGALLIFDEPTTGLHFDDVALLIRVFQRLVEQGESLLVIEHNLEVIKCADYLVDLGPEAGADGGRVGRGYAGDLGPGGGIEHRERLAGNGGRPGIADQHPDVAFGVFPDALREGHNRHLKPLPRRSMTVLRTGLYPVEYTGVIEGAARS